MADKEVVVRGIEWNRVLSVGHLMRAFRIAFWPPAKLLLCLAAIAITVGVGMLLDLAFRTDVLGQSYAANMIDVYRAAIGCEINVRPDRSFQLIDGTVVLSETDYLREIAKWPTDEDKVRFRMKFGDSPGVFAYPARQSAGADGIFGFRGFWWGPAEAIRHMGRLVIRYWQTDKWFAFLNTAIALLVWTFFGGATCRLAAMQFARDERPSILSALRFACRRYASLVASPLALFIVIVLVGASSLIPASLILLIPYVGELVIGILFVLLILVGLILSLLAIFAVGSLGLQTPAIAAEGRDAFDAVSRGVNYVVSRPWRYILYTLFSLVYLCFSFVLVRVFVFLVLWLPWAGIANLPWNGAGENTAAKIDRIWAEPALWDLFRMPDSSGTEAVSAILVAIPVFILLGMMLAFIPSFILTSQTIIYFLIRRMVDFKDLDEVHMDEEELTGLERLEQMETRDETAVEPKPAPAAKDKAANKPSAGQADEPAADPSDEKDD